jgi:hypothetical protein
MLGAPAESDQIKVNQTESDQYRAKKAKGAKGRWVVKLRNEPNFPAKKPMTNDE